MSDFNLAGPTFFWWLGFAVTLFVGGQLVDALGKLVNKLKRDNPKRNGGSSAGEEKERQKAMLKDCCTHVNAIDPIDPFTLAGLTRVGGLDVSYDKHSDTAFATLAVLQFPSLRLLASSTVRITMHPNQQYVPGFLADRECEAFKQAWDAYREEHGRDLLPNIVVVDGNGYLHPNRFGSACQIGVELDVPTIGVAKKLMKVGEVDVNAIVRQTQEAGTHQYVMNVASEARAGPAFDATSASRDAILWRSVGVDIQIVKPYKSAAIWGGNRRDQNRDLLGYSVIVDPDTPLSRNSSAQRCKPIFVSSGHRTDAAFAKNLAIACSIHRVPEPVRQADLISRHYVREFQRVGFE